MVDRRRGVPTTKTVVSVALILYCAAIFTITWIPNYEMTWVGWFSGSLALIAIVGLIAHATDIVTLPGEEYAYLVSGWAGFTTAMLYLIDTNDVADRRVAVTLLLMAGVIGSYGAYLAEVEDYDDG